MPTDTYCGVAPFSEDSSPSCGCPFGRPLAVEIEFEGRSLRVANVHLNVALAGLQKYLRGNLCGMPIGHAYCCGLAPVRGVYRARFSGQIRKAVADAVVLFMENRFEDWQASFNEELALQFHREVVEGRPPPASKCEARPIWGRWPELV